jgi:O-antigen/teichoic acid export membrane protein
LKADTPLATVCDETEAPHAAAPLEKTKPAENAPKNGAKRRTIFNMALNLGGTATDAVAGFIVTPILIRTLGDETYGVWLLISAFFYMGLLDLGMRSAIGRFIAFHRARGDHASSAKVISTATAALTMGGCVACLVCFTAAVFLPRLFTIPPENATPARFALAIIGVQLGGWFVLRSFDAVLWAHQRFDLINGVDIPTSILRAVLFVMVVRQWEIVGLATVSMITTLGNGAVKSLLARCVCGTAIHLSRAAFSTFRELVSYGIWTFLTTNLALARAQLSPIIIGAALGIQHIASFSIVMRLPSLANIILSSVTGVFAPQAVEMHAKGESLRLRRLLIDGTQFSLIIALYFLTLFACLGKPLLSIWIAPRFAESWPLLMAIALGEVLPMSMSVSPSLLYATAQHCRLTWLSIAEALMGIGGGTVAAWYFGVFGFTVALASAAFICRGLLVMRSVSQVTSLSLYTWGSESFIRPVVLAAVAFAAFQLVCNWHAPTNWATLFAYGITFSILYGVMTVLVVIGWQAAKDMICSRLVK